MSIQAVIHSEVEKHILDGERCASVVVDGLPGIRLPWTDGAREIERLLWSNNETLWEFELARPFQPDGGLPENDAEVTAALINSIRADDCVEER